MKAQPGVVAHACNANIQGEGSPSTLEADKF